MTKNNLQKVIALAIKGGFKPSPIKPQYHQFDTAVSPVEIQVMGLLASRWFWRAVGRSCGWHERVCSRCVASEFKLRKYTCGYCFGYDHKIVTEAEYLYTRAMSKIWQGDSVEDILGALPFREVKNGVQITSKTINHI